MKKVSLLKDPKLTNVVLNVSENALIESEALDTVTNEEIHAWMETHPFVASHIAEMVCREEAQTMREKNIAVIMIDDDEDFRYDDELFSNYYGLAISHGTDKEKEDYLFQVHHRIQKQIEDEIKKYFKKS